MDIWTSSQFSCKSVFSDLCTAGSLPCLLCCKPWSTGRLVLLLLCLIASTYNQKAVPTKQTAQSARDILSLHPCCFTAHPYIDWPWKLLQQPRPPNIAAPNAAGKSVQDLALKAMQGDDPESFRCAALLLAQLHKMPKAVALEGRGHDFEEDDPGPFRCAALLLAPPARGLPGASSSTRQVSNFASLLVSESHAMCLVSAAVQAMQASHAIPAGVDAKGQIVQCEPRQKALALKNSYLWPLAELLAWESGAEWSNTFHLRSCPLGVGLMTASTADGLNANKTPQAAPRLPLTVLVHSLLVLLGTVVCKWAAPDD